MSGRDASGTGTLENRRFALVGAGRLGEMALAMWPEALRRPEFVLDSTRTGHIAGVEIRNLPSHNAIPGLTYLASVFSIPAPELKGILRRLGQDDIVTIYDVFETFTPSLFTNGWQNLAPNRETERRLAALPSLYADALSRQNCEGVTAWRYRRELRDDYPLSPAREKYDLRLFGRAGTHYDVVYDCGSYDLGLIAHLADAGITFDRLIAFEPDPANHATCLERLSAWDERTKASVSVEARAISDRCGAAAFLANGLLAARLLADRTQKTPQTIEVETATLDTIHGEAGAGAGRVLIKLHVEGAEPAALAGAERLLRQARCDLLVTLSHDEASYLDIPEVLAGLGTHDLCLRSYALFGEALTLFAGHRV